ncbi:unnamed protein product [Brassica napus]|uniref:(rape) hypothetical protein n=1 Tax=Brassica napus TaxID=3708 RepID=A0A817BFF6_BRANA|nr:unnamed protein product [Brassica napus]
MSHEPVNIGLPKLASKKFTYHGSPTMGIKHRRIMRQKVAADDNRGCSGRPTKHLSKHRLSLTSSTRPASSTTPYPTSQAPKLLLSSRDPPNHKHHSNKLESRSYSERQVDDKLATTTGPAQ